MGKYTLWKAELAQPVPESDRATRADDPALICGFWRIQGARTKPSYPVAIWPQDGASGPVIFFMVGAGKVEGESMFDTLTAHERVQDFLHNGSWLKCSAVSEDAYHAAMASGRWEDGQPSRRISETERLDLVPDTPQAQGGNNPVGEDGEPIDLFHQQVTEKLTKALADAAAIKWPFPSLEEANKAAEVIERLRALGRQGEAKRKEEKAPWIEGGTAVDAKWALVKDASDKVQALVSAVETFKRAERNRLQREADERERLERERIAKEAREESERHGQPVDEQEIAARVEETIAASPAPVIEAPRVGTAYGRAVSKARVRTGDVTDIKAFLLYLLDQGDTELLALLQKRANALARVGVKAPGMEIKTE